jgi:hypothetical protein
MGKKVVKKPFSLCQKTILKRPIEKGSVQKLRDGHRMKYRPKRIDQNVELGIAHSLADGLGKAGAHAENLALMGNLLRGGRNREVYRPAHGMKIAIMPLLSHLTGFLRLEKKDWDDCQEDEKIFREPLKFFFPSQ